MAYALSPIDLIPDFVPVLGYLDDLILIPLGITLAIRMIPPEILSEHRAIAMERLENEGPTGRAAGAVILILWLAVLFFLAKWGYKLFRKG